MKSKQSAESKQTADVIKIHKFSYTTSLYCVSESISASMAKSKQSAKSKQTADLFKNHNFSYPTTLYSISKVISASIKKVHLKKKNKANYHPLTCRLRRR